MTYMLSSDVEKGKAELAAELAALAAEGGQVSLRGADASEYTWFKLSEWMQVRCVCAPCACGCECLRVGRAARGRGGDARRGSLDSSASKAHRASAQL